MPGRRYARIFFNIDAMNAPIPLAAIGTDEFKGAMRRLAGGVSIVTSSYDGSRFGLAVTAVCSVSLSPPSLLVCVNRASSSHEPIRLSGSFCVNVLHDGHEDIARRFGSSKLRDIRFDGGDWRTLVTGASALVGATVSFDCRVRESLFAHSHSIFIGEVVAVELGGGRTPLVYFDGAYMTTAPVPLAERQSSAVAPSRSVPTAKEGGGTS